MTLIFIPPMAPSVSVRVAPSSFACRGARALRASAARAAAPRAVRSQAVMSSESWARVSVEKPTLYDMPISNNGAKVRLVIYKKGLEGEVDIVSPADLGGLKSPEYLAANPLGKMPTLALPDGSAFPESQVILEYLMDKYASLGPSLLPATPEGRAQAALVARMLDIYIGGVQGCMYRGPMDATVRAAQIKEIAVQLDNLETVVQGPYVAGDEMCFGDLSIFPTFVFMTYMLPTYFGWGSVFTGRPKLAAWWELMLQDGDVQRVHGELTTALDEWAAGGRWDKTGINDTVANEKGLQWAY
mmetsp:Transcript_19876/g.63255  ORF Transcript_19876/g.63255 Transcript_19876/m.63255 type:complete len:300 (+) Transcript_19876:1-900(+)